MLHRQIYILWRQGVTPLCQWCVACQLSFRKDKHSRVAEDWVARTHSIPNLWDGHWPTKLLSPPLNIHANFIAHLAQINYPIVNKQSSLLIRTFPDHLFRGHPNLLAYLCWGSHRSALCLVRFSSHLYYQSNSVFVWCFANCCFECNIHHY